MRYPHDLHHFFTDASETSHSLAMHVQFSRPFQDSLRERKLSGIALRTLHTLLCRFIFTLCYYQPTSLYPVHMCVREHALFGKICPHLLLPQFSLNCSLVEYIYTEAPTHAEELTWKCVPVCLLVCLCASVCVCASRLWGASTASRLHLQLRSSLQSPLQSCRAGSTLCSTHRPGRAHVCAVELTESHFKL